MGWATALATLFVVPGTAAAIDVQLPPPPAEQPPQSAPPADGSGALPAIASAPTAAASSVPSPARAGGALLGLRPLSRGAFGRDVRELQRLLRKRGFRLTVDGAYGAQTQRVVRRLQRRFHQHATGTADADFLARLGVQLRGVASVSPATPAPGSGPTPTAGAPLVGPNAASAKYLKAFPVAGKHSYRDDFGEPRGQGPHEGNDIIADKGTPVVAVANGSIDRLTRVETGLGGIWIWLKDDAGTTYYYAHLSAIADGLEAGSRVTTAQVIGNVGNTGDARYTVAHLHFELHPGGGAAVSPYSELVAVDPTPPKR